MAEELYALQHDSIPSSVFNFYSNQLEIVEGVDPSQFQLPQTSMFERLSPVVIHEPKTTPTSTPLTVIYLHGLGGSGAESKAYAQHWQQQYPELRIIAPTAPKIPISMNFGLMFNAWFDLKSLGSDEKTVIEESIDGFAYLHRSVVFLRHFISEVCTKYSITPNNIILGGFSLGGATAYSLVLQSNLKVAGLFSFSGFYPTLDAEQGSKQLKLFVDSLSSSPAPSPEDKKEQKEQDNKKGEKKQKQKQTPHTLKIFHSAGGNDEIVQLWASEKLNEEFTKAQIPNWSYHLYPKMHHTISKATMKDFMVWIDDIISSSNKDKKTKPTLTVDISATNTSSKADGDDVVSFDVGFIPNTPQSTTSTKSTDFSFYDVLSSPVHNNPSEIESIDQTQELVLESFDLIGMMANESSHNSTTIPEDSILANTFVE